MISKTMNDIQTVKALHFNKPQIKAMLINAKEEYAIWGRGTGKSEGRIAPAAERDIFAMPRGCGVFVGSTYQQILTRTLPAVIAGWERMGYKRDIHFFVGKHPPKKWNWPTPYISPLKYDYFIQWFNGSGIHLVSQDRVGSSNGLSIDWIKGDEAKNLNKERLETELYPTNRGNMAYFKDCPWHHGILLCTDMPTSSGGKWLLEKSKDMDPELIDIILSIQGELFQLREQLLRATITKAKVIARQIRKYEQHLIELRKDCVYYSEASALENIEVLGIDYIKQQKRLLPDLIYRAQVLNERITQIENGFYGLLDENVHLYDQFNYSYLDSHNYNFEALKKIDSRMDGDVDSNAILEVAGDCGASFNGLVVGQEHGREFKYLKAIYVLHPELFRDAINKFCDYYEYHRKKVVIYYYDHTMVGTNGLSRTSYSQEFIDVMTDRGWVVIPEYIGQAYDHHYKYLIMGLTLREKDINLPKLRYNRTNCSNLILSMQQAGVKEGKKGFEKDKRPEGKKIDQSTTTHFSDAADTLFIGKYGKLFVNHPGVAEIMTSG